MSNSTGGRRQPAPTRARRPGMGRITLGGTALVTLAAALGPAQAEASLGTEAQFVANTFSFLVWGALVMWMCAGFTMLEAGSVRTKNASVICMKNIGLYSIAGLTYYLIGYNLMYVDVGDWMGSVSLLLGSATSEVALLSSAEAAKAAALEAAEAVAALEAGLLSSDEAAKAVALEAAKAAALESATAEVIKNDYATRADWFFQMVFVATAASVVSGALAERVKLWSFLAFTVLLTGIIYPVVGAWTWGGGWLDQLGFKDFAGSTIVHSTGGWAALAGILIIGARRGKFRPDGTVKATPPSNVPAVTLGVLILWLGWFGFNGGSQLALAGALDAVAMSNVIVNTNLAAAAGVIAAMAVSRPRFGRLDILVVLNGAIAGLVSITAGPDMTDHYWAVIIGAIGGIVCSCGLRFLEFLKLDDVVGAVPAHLFAGIWGTLAVCIASGGDLSSQLVGILAVGGFAFGVSILFWLAIDRTIGARVSPQVEDLGQDVAELGIEAYPEFVVMPDQEDLDALSNGPKDAEGR